MYQPNQQVLAKDDKGNIVNGILMHSVLLGGKPHWWVCFKRDKHDEITVVEEDTLNFLNKVCSCGSDKLKHPGHSTWCDKNVSL